ncbi:hypothetical protein ACIBEJ_14345 [Nonomuraea sp. NPDC050790]|uniref:hypothetical protein n=1 Tax=Nonomuraea sp. NPDC050790 TaxID=3364371 RepID=UPI00379E9D9C
MGGFWAVAGALAVRLVPSSHVPRATVIIFGGVGAANVFSAYTFISPVLRDVSGIDGRLVGPLLFGFGVAGIAGNFVAGAAVATRLHPTVLSITAVLGVTVLLYPLAGLTGAGGVVLLVIWGLVYGGVSASLQTWMIKAAPQAVEEASALWVAVFNLSIGLGALAGGAVVDALPLQGILWLAGGLVLAAGPAVWSARRILPPGPRRH